VAPVSLARRRRALLLCLGALAAPATADIVIEVSGVDGDIKRNVLTFLSLQRYAKQSNLAADTVERIAQRVPMEVKSALRPFGYYEPTVKSNLNAEGNGWRATISIDPGVPVILDEVDLQISGPGASDRVFRNVLKLATLKQGDRLNHSAYERVKGELERAAAAFGYLDATLDRHELLVDPPKHRAEVHLSLNTGPRYRFGATKIEQKVIDPALMRRYIRYSAGDYFDTSALLHTQFSLDDSQYFSVIEVLPGERDTRDLTVPVTVQGTANKRNRYSFGAGYGTDTRWRGTVAWDDRLINTQGHHSRIAIKASGIDQEIDASYIIPVGDPALEKFSIEATDGRLLLGDITSTGVTVKPGLTQVRGNWQRVLFVSFDRLVSTTTYTRTSDRLLIPGISYASLPPGFFGQPVAGRGLYMELSGSNAALGSNSNFLRFFAQDDLRFNLAPRWHLLLRGQLGLSAVSRFSELPAVERFFAGGDRSVRGFGLNDLSPVDSHGSKIGGRDLIVGSVEIERDLPRNFGVATFFDAGNAMNSITDPLEYSVGIGVRYRLPAISVGIDVAQAISRSDLGPRLHLNIEPSF
jgi:translocation and assembly module TamA